MPYETACASAAPSMPIVGISAKLRPTFKTSAVHAAAMLIPWRAWLVKRRVRI